jgi:hypothetical protein
MELTFDKRTYNIEDGEHIYQVVHIKKHPTPKYNTNKHYFYILIEGFEGDKFFGHFEPDEELKTKLKKFIKEIQESNE